MTVGTVTSLDSHPEVNSHPEVICAGIIIADLVARPVERLPEKGRLALVDEISLHLGGSAANTGAQLVRLGHRVGVAGRVGADSLGGVMLSDMQRLGLDVSGVLTDPQSPTSATVVQVDAEGERSFLHALGCSAQVQVADFPLGRWQAAGVKVLHVAGYHILPTLEPQLPALFQEATRLGLTTSLDCVWDASGQWQSIRAVLPHTDIFCPSLQEAQGITGLHEPAEVATQLFKMGVRQLVALKMGEHGSYVQRRGEQAVTVAAPKVRAIDGTGAGDSFIAGVLSGWLRGLSLGDLARLGNAAGGLCAAALGGTSGLESYAATWEVAQGLTANS